MKILLINIHGIGSSTGRIVYELYTFINKIGNDAAICYGRGSKIREKNVFKFGLDWETYSHALLTRTTGYTGYFSWFSTRRLIKYIENFKPDIVHLHELHAYFLNLKPLFDYLKRNCIKTILTLHCEDFYTGKCGYSYECEQWKSYCSKCPHLHDYVSTLIFDHTKEMFFRKKSLIKGFNDLVVISPSNWLANRAKQSFLKDYQIEVINNGISTDTFYPRKRDYLRKKYNISTNEKVVLSIAAGIMDHRKGGKHVIEIAKLLQNKKIRFILLGVDKVKEVKEIKDNIILLGKTSDKEILAEHYSLADIFVICSKQDNFPTTCLEAQACGTPVYGFDVGGIKETSLITENHFVNYGNISKLSQMIENAPLKTEKSSLSLASEAKKKFDNEIMLQKYKEIYNRLYSTK